MPTVKYSLCQKVRTFRHQATFRNLLAFHGNLFPWRRLTHPSTRTPAIKPLAPVMSNVEAVGKPLLEKMQKRVRNLTSQNRLYGTISPSGMVNVPPYLPRTLRRGFSYSLVRL